MNGAALGRDGVPGVCPGGGTYTSLGVEGAEKAFPEVATHRQREGGKSLLLE